MSGTKNTLNQVNATGNQSTGQYSHDVVFLGDNDFDTTTLNNTSASATLTLQSGMLLHKSAAEQVDVVDAASEIANIVGFLMVDGDGEELADAATKSVQLCIRGKIAEENIVLPSGITLATVIPTTQRTLRDHLNSLGFHLISSVENTKFDNA